MKKLRIPRKAVQPLTEACIELSEDWGKPADEIFEECLRMMKKYSKFFFSQPFPETVKKTHKLGLNDDEYAFIEAAKTYRDECNRFLVVCLRRNMSMEGFDKKRFLSNYRFYGKNECDDCLVPEVMELRKKWKEYEDLKRKVDEEVKSGNPSQYAKVWHEGLKEPNVIKHYKMLEVKLWLFEEEAELKGKTCHVQNKYLCPYGAESKNLIEDGWAIKKLWEILEWYDRHWHRYSYVVPSRDEMKWYHYDEPDIIDVTSIEDVDRALEDGRIDRIIDEYIKYVEETGKTY